MSSATHSEATAAPVAAEPERKSAANTPRGLPATVLRMQRAAGNQAVAQTLARSPARAVARCGANCSCNSCSGGHGHEEELLEEQLGAGLLRSAVANRTA
jgi:hypothetical protein